MFARVQGVGLPALRRRSGRLQFSAESYETLVKPRVITAWNELSDEEKGTSTGPSLIFKNAIRDSIYDAMSKEEKDALNERAEAFKKVQVAEFDAAVAQMPSKDPEFMFR